MRLALLFRARCRARMCLYRYSNVRYVLVCGNSSALRRGFFFDSAYKPGRTLSVCAAWMLLTSCRC